MQVHYNIIAAQSGVKDMKKGSKNPRPINHGTHHSYVVRECRCDICKEEELKRVNKSRIKCGIKTVIRQREGAWKYNNIKLNGKDVKWHDFIEIYNKQNCKCYICNRDLLTNGGNRDDGISGRYKSDVDCLDHNHITGEVRGILCQDCNALLGYAKDNIDILKKSIIYLERN